MRFVGRVTPPGDHGYERRHRAVLLVLVALTALVSGLLIPVAPAAAAACTGSIVVCENELPGTPQSVWDVEGSGDEGLQGFATEMSVNVGQRVDFKIKTAASTYTVDIYRLGWYEGNGARLMQRVTPSAALPQTQPACVDDAATGLYDCGTWRVSASWLVPAAAVSGVYIAKLTDPSTADESHIPFVVRDDSSRSKIVFQTSDTTWQAYNNYGGSSLYTGGPIGRAVKVSYNRPFATRGVVQGRDYLFSNEFPMLQFLERNGYDVSYISGIDTDRRGALLTNHKVFLSVGHDEYWSAQQRANVEAARDAGVNLAFFSGNSVYWKTRWERSVDGAASAYRTLVSYKETRDNAKTDPDSAWTGTWRDPRFSPPSDGGRPENALMGTAYMSNFTDLPITVADHEADYRLWRNTGLSSMATGQTTPLAPHTVGYESDEDLDNGFRPPGLIRLSTTTGPTPEYLRDYGSTVTPGTTTHNLTMYKAPSGARVFGAGTVQWAWGLGQNHDGNGAPADARIQQATVNILADMQAQPATLMASLVPASASTDVQAPVSTVSTPAAGTSVANGTSVTVTGTATDSGGRVAGIEVSTDGGGTWHPATGRESWTYTYIQTGQGSVDIRARAVDDSGNIGGSAVRSLVATCPCSLFGASAPSVPASGDTSSVEIGVKFVPQVDGFISGVRFYKGEGNGGTHTGTLWSSAGAALATGTFTNETATGWQTLAFADNVPVVAGMTYVASYFTPSGRYAADSQYFAKNVVASPLRAPGSPSGALNGVYRASGTAGFPQDSYGQTNYWVDVLFTTTDTSPPVVVSTTPFASASSVPVGVRPSATFSKAVAPASVTMSLRNSAGQPVSGTAAFDVAAKTVTFTPAAPLTAGSSYSASARGSSTAGVAMPAAFDWSFTTALPTPAPGVCPCSIWNDTSVPQTITAQDGGNVELGVKFTADVNGTVSGVKFYKGPQNTGTHTGSLWSAAGQLLASATFSQESSTGWQTVVFSSPVPVTAGTTYVVSYRAPNGRYSVDAFALERSGVDNPPLHATYRGAVYTYGAGFPTNTSTTNYWVDVVYNPADVAPTVQSRAPGDRATNVNIGAAATATFSGFVQNGSAAITVKAPDGSVVPGGTSWDATTRTVALTPTAALQEGVTYTATVSGARALSGAQMTPSSWTFTTAGVTACPCTLFESTAVPTVVDAGDSSSIELGVRFTPSVDGTLTGVRFFKSASNTGIHTGSLWTSSGGLLATATFGSESASGWQTVSFSAAVKVKAGVTYVASYLAPRGHYSATSRYFASTRQNGPLSAPGGGNGVYRYGAAGGFPSSSYNATNYWVDPLFSPAPTAPVAVPEVDAQEPLAGATSVSVGVTPAAVFSTDVQSASVQMSLRDPVGAAVAGDVAYDATSRTARFTPSVALDRGTTYRVSVRATSTDGGQMPASVEWSFTTAQPTPTPGTCPCSLWDETAAPATVTVQDSGNVELGVRFTADVSGSISGVRFYKGPQNVGTHTGSIWSAAGDLLGSAVFVNESSTGWQTVTFVTPVPVAAGVTYVASYRAPMGKYSATGGQLAAGADAAPLHVPVSGGVYTYGSGFPGSSSTANYWVDVVFATAP